MEQENEKLRCDLESKKEELEWLIKEHNKLVEETNNTDIQKNQSCSDPPKSEPDFRTQEVEHSSLLIVEEKNCSMEEKEVNVALLCIIAFDNSCSI